MPQKMFLERIHSPGLAHISYILGHGGKAAVIDPRRDVQAYLEIAREHDCQITHIFETHKNEDYVIGSQDLARRTGAEILHGEGLDWQYGQAVSEGDSFSFGDAQLKVLSTPGHTDESISLVLCDAAFGDEPVAVFTGDALFVGDVGRTDFYPDRAEEVAGLLYDSLFEKLLPLGDHVLVLPAHGAGSVCGSQMAAREFTTIGYEKKHNHALQADSRDEFIRMKTSEEHHMPPYFSRMEDYNRTGDAPRLEELPAPRAMSPGQVEEMSDRAQLVDIRSTEAFAGMFIPGSIHIPLSMLPVFAGWLLDYDRPIILIPEGPEQLDQAVRHLARVGYDRVEGYLRGGVHSWQISGRRYDHIPAVTADHVDQAVKQNAGWTVLDVRKEQKFRKAHVPGAHHCYVGKLPAAIDEIPKAEPIVTLCGSGKMAMIAASILKRNGYSDVRCNLGSMAAMQNVDGEFLTEESGKEAHA